MRELSNFGTGFNGFRSRIEMISEALGNTINVRIAVSEAFEDSLKKEQQELRSANVYTPVNWSRATDRDFDYAGSYVESYMGQAPKDPIIAIAPWEKCVLELRADCARLHGGDFYLIVGLVSNTRSYSSRARANVESWSPFLTDTGSYAAYGSRYSGHGDMKSVTVKSEAAAGPALRRLMEKHFKVAFVDTPA